jgi:outer membrane lipoprotein SlyB
MKWILQHKLLLIGIIAGAMLGFLYWNFIGCNSGTCLITSKWQNSTAYGAIMGGLFVSMFKKQ